jgi:hypothetical protein
MESRERIWQKARGCESSECIEVAREGELVLLRNSADPNGPVLTATSQEWAVFVHAVRLQEFGEA